jgi:hypothetical protein
LRVVQRHRFRPSASAPIEISWRGRDVDLGQANGRGDRILRRAWSALIIDFDPGLASFALALAPGTHQLIGEQLDEVRHHRPLVGLSV